MDDTGFHALAAEIKGYMDKEDYVQCLKKLDSYLELETDLKARSIHNLGKATCALHLNNVSVAKEALSNVDTRTMSNEERIYLDRVQISIFEKDKNWLAAKELLTRNLEKPELQYEEHGEVRYEFLGKMGCALTNLGQFREALKYLKEGKAGTEKGAMLDSFCAYEANCLQALDLPD
jgi:hypothetical protein